MFCPKCGKELKTGDKFCPACGAMVTHGALESNKEAEDSNRYSVPSIKKKNPMKKIIIVALILFVIGGIGIFFLSGGKSGHLTQEGKKLLNDGHISESISYFQSAIEENQKNAEAYQLLSDAYLKNDEYEQAKSTIDNASSFVGDDEKIQKMHQDMKNGIYRTSEGDPVYEKIQSGSDGNLAEVIYSEKGILSQISLTEDEEKTIAEFDTAGNCVKVSAYDSGEVDSYETCKYEYDLEGNLIKMYSESDYDYDDEYDSWYKAYEYDSKNNITEIKICDANEELIEYTTCKYEYDLEGNVIKESIYPNGEFGWYHIYEYDLEGNVIKESSYGTDGELGNYQTYEYDTKGNLIRESSYDSDDKGFYDWYKTYEYDTKGNLIKKSSYDTDGELGDYQTYEYDTKGNLIKKSNYDTDGELNDYQTYEYNSENTLMKIKCISDESDWNFSDYRIANGKLLSQLFPDEPTID